MGWTTLNYSKNRVDWAGKILVSQGLAGPFKAFQDLLDWTEALEIINNFRSSHGYPLHATSMTLRQRIPRVDDRGVVVSRLKRLPSVEDKLARFSWLKLSRMQDVGGCRAVLRTVKRVEQLHDIYQSGRTTSKMRRVDNYIESPKSDGYRGIHYVYEYRATSAKNRVYDGFQVEVQLRSSLQHVWATANETVSTFTGQRLKAGRGQDRWLRFFALMSNALAFRERRNLVPDVPGDRETLTEELGELARELDVEIMLRGWQTALNVLEDQPTDARVFLLVLDPTKQTLRTIPFVAERTALASAQYLSVEKEIEKNPRIEAVLVKADSVAALKRGYPNYYVDVSAFLQALAFALKD